MEEIVKASLNSMVLDNENLISALWGFVNFYLETLKYRTRTFILLFNIFETTIDLEIL